MPGRSGTVPRSSCTPCEFVSVRRDCIFGRQYSGLSTSSRLLIAGGRGRRQESCPPVSRITVSLCGVPHLVSLIFQDAGTVTSRPWYPITWPVEVGTCVPLGVPLPTGGCDPPGFRVPMKRTSEPSVISVEIAIALRRRRRRRLPAMAAIEAGSGVVFGRYHPTARSRRSFTSSRIAASHLTPQFQSRTMQSSANRDGFDPEKVCRFRRREPQPVDEDHRLSLRDGQRGDGPEEI